MDHHRHPVASAGGDRGLHPGRGARSGWLGVHPDARDHARPGLLVLRRAGRGEIARFRVAVADTRRRRHPGQHRRISSPFWRGFCCSFRAFSPISIGAVLLSGPVRRWCGRHLPRLDAAAAIRATAPRSISRRTNGSRCPIRELPDANVAAPTSSLEAARSRVLVRDGAPVLATAAQLPRIAIVTVRRRVHREHHQRRPGRSRTAAGARSSNVLAQYIKDFSFENPNAPRSLQQTRRSRRSTSRSTSTPSRWPTPTSRSSSSSKARPKPPARVLFSFELDYAGVFRIQNMPQEQRAAAGDDRMPAAAVPVRPRDRRDRGAQRRLPAAAARSGRFRRALSAAHGAGQRAAARPARRSTVSRLRSAIIAPDRACRRASRRRRDAPRARRR